MASTSARRPWPALIAMLALLLLAAIVWWRVLNRDSGSTAAPACPTGTAPAATLPAPNRVTVLVLNATDRNGIGGKARSTLVSDGFNSPAAAANDKPNAKIRGVAEIRYGRRGRDGAVLLHYYLPGARLVRTDSKSATVVVSLGARYTGIASPSSVSATLRRKQIELETEPPGPPSSSPTC